MRIFAALMTAKRDINYQITSQMSLLRMHDDDERVARQAALQTAMNDCLRCNPISEGYSDHKVDIMEVPREWILEAAAQPFADVTSVDADVWDVEIGNLD